MGNEIEMCCKCSEPTGRAGRCEDSMYAGDAGPYCEDCWADVPEEQANEIDMHKRDLTRLRAELEEANKKLRHYERTVCLDDDLVSRHPDGVETKPISTVKLGELFAERDELTKALAEANDNRVGMVAALDEARRELANCKQQMAVEAEAKHTHKARADAAETLLADVRRHLNAERHPGQGEHWIAKQIDAFLASPGGSGGERPANSCGADQSLAGQPPGVHDYAKLMQRTIDAQYPASARPDMGFEVRQMGSAETVVVQEEGDGAHQRPSAADFFGGACHSLAGHELEDLRIEFAATLDAIHCDVADLLIACGLGNHARPASCHEVIHNEILPRIREMSDAIAWVPTDPDAQPAQGGDDGN